MSRDWHDLVLSCPRVWARIYIHFRTPLHPQSEAHNLESYWEEELDEIRDKPRPLGLWFSRAGASDLYVKMEIGRRSAHPMHIYSATNHIANHAPKLRELELDIHSSYTLNAILKIVLEQAPRLCYLTCACAPSQDVASDGSEFYKLTDFAAVVRNAPSLRSLTCRGCILSQPLDTPPLRHVTSLLLDEVHFKSFDLGNVLKALPEIEFLTCTNCTFEQTRPEFEMDASVLPQFFGLNKLRTLVFDRISIYLLSSIEWNFTVPNAQSLSIKNLASTSKLSKLSNELAMEKMESLGSDLVSFSALMPSIQKLFLGSAAITDCSLLRILQNTPQLLELHITDSFIGRTAIRGLSRIIPDSQGDSMICPKLYKLTLHFCPIVTGDMLLELIASRHHSGRHDFITSLEVEQCEQVTPESIVSLQEAVGCMLHIAYTPYIEA